MRILILTASYGSGHNEAARSLGAEFERVGAEVVIVDHFRELVHPRFERLSSALYYWLLRRARLVWGLAYELGDWMASDSALSFGATTLGRENLRRLLGRLAPDAVVTVHATPAVILSSLVAAGRRVPPHTTVVTDFVAHRQWIAPRINRYCVAAPSVRHELLVRGVPSDRILVTGVPVRAEFEQPISRAEARGKLGFSPEVPVVLAMAGSDGVLGRMPDIAHTLVDLGRPLEGVLIAGQNRDLAERLEQLTAGSALRVLPYVSEIRALMAAADFIVTKAGGMTLAEAIAAEAPLILYGSLPGQERRNERFASRAGIGLVARARRELRNAVERALDDPKLLEDLRRRIREVRQPGASRRIVSAVLERDASVAKKSQRADASAQGNVA